MPLDKTSQAGELLPALHVRQRYNISDMTLWRWEKDPKLQFPAPIRINGRRYWRLADLQGFELRQSSQREAA
ncbi:transcriptional regulator [Methylobacterium sp. DB0501]|uniref:helix-turn-helix transcriptional regulator n=1 Tax=Methylobacterium sp. DB0501 TaxID=2709665 RepID=UPI0013EDC40A|nr:transcriptional regulator [Methylobacterium sp. DB0501]NGM33331.1 transcriptional regulator [Methylobacterium sp. DB0501]